MCKEKIFKACSKIVKNEVNMSKDLFGNEIIVNPLLRDKYIEPPFSILDSKNGKWQRRKKQWIDLGIKSEIGRDNKKVNSIRLQTDGKDISQNPYSSIFDPYLCEILYKWFCIDGGEILDCFSGGSVRGIVANYLGYKYTGIDIREEQIDSNIEQAKQILDINNQPTYYVGDSNKVLDTLTDKEFDFIFSCPPYTNLEVYSDLDGDLSNMRYDEFIMSYERIIKKSCSLLKYGGYACFVVGEVRDKKGNYIGFVPDTIKAFQKCGMDYYNEAILVNSFGSGALRINGNMKTNKLVKVHQNILVFKK
jgi:hypothetical protein